MQLRHWLRYCESSLDNYSSDEESNLTVVIWTLILTKMLWRRLNNTDESGVNDIDDETPTVSDNDDDSNVSRLRSSL